MNQSKQKNTIYLDHIDFRILHNILEKYFKKIPFDAIVFGSRSKGSHQKFSDLDLCLKFKKITLDDIKYISFIESIKEDCTESQLSIVIDLSCYHLLSQNFQQIIDTEGVLFPDQL